MAKRTQLSVAAFLCLGKGTGHGNCVVTLAPGSFRCNRGRCKTCRFIKEGTTSYTFFATTEQKGIRHHITCSSSKLVYMIQCIKCRIQYKGETKCRLRVFKEYPQKYQIWESETNPNQGIPNQVPKLGFVSLSQI